MKFRDLTSEEIEVRVQSVAKNDKGVILLLYKDARVDQNILDETVTPKHWQKDYYEANGILFCKVGINVGALTGTYDTWVWKSDCGSESNIEAQKGEASDAFKRACFNWGIGRELYTALDTLQSIVGGYIECIYPFEDNVGIICNEEGKLIGLEPNRVLRDDEGNIYDIIFGTFIVTGLTEDDFGSLTDEQVEKYSAEFFLPELIFKADGKLVVLRIYE